LLFRTLSVGAHTIALGPITDIMTREEGAESSSFLQRCKAVIANAGIPEDMLEALGVWFWRKDTHKLAQLRKEEKLTKKRQDAAAKEKLKEVYWAIVCAQEGSPEAEGRTPLEAIRLMLEEHQKRGSSGDSSPKRLAASILEKQLSTTMDAGTSAPKDESIQQPFSTSMMIGSTLSPSSAIGMTPSATTTIPSQSPSTMAAAVSPEPLPIISTITLSSVPSPETEPSANPMPASADSLPLTPLSTTTTIERASQLSILTDTASDAPLHATPSQPTILSSRQLPSGSRPGLLATPQSSEVASTEESFGPVPNQTTGKQADEQHTSEAPNTFNSFMAHTPTNGPISPVQLQSAFAGTITLGSPPTPIDKVLEQPAIPEDNLSPFQPSLRPIHRQSPTPPLSDDMLSDTAGPESPLSPLSPVPDSQLVASARETPSPLKIKLKAAKGVPTPWKQAQAARVDRLENPLQGSRQSRRLSSLKSGTVKAEQEKVKMEKFWAKVDRSFRTVSDPDSHHATYSGPLTGQGEAPENAPLEYIQVLLGSMYRDFFGNEIIEGRGKQARVVGFEYMLPQEILEIKERDEWIPLALRERRQKSLRKELKAIFPDVPEQEMEKMVKELKENKMLGAGLESSTSGEPPRKKRKVDDDAAVDASASTSMPVLSTTSSVYPPVQSSSPSAASRSTEVPPLASIVHPVVPLSTGRIEEVSIHCSYGGSSILNLFSSGSF
jgi:hypothetical protein